MPKQKTLACLNSILNLFVLGMPPSGKFLEVRSFGGGDHEYLFIPTREADQAFDLAVKKLLCSFPKVKGTVSQATFLDKLIPLIREKKISGQEFTLADVEQFERAICDLPLQKFKVVRRIYGVALSGGDCPVQMGDFLIGMGSQIFGATERTPFFAQTFKPEDLQQPFVECAVEARDTDTAIELADFLFYRFELIFRVFIGHRTRHLEVGILNYVGPQMRDRFVLTDKDRLVRQGSSWEGSFQPFLLGDPGFPMPTGPFIRLFQLISAKNNNKFERQVLRCAEWTGQAIADANAASAFVKAAIALEVMFSTNQKGVITASKMAQIAESCAFLLGDGWESSSAIEHKIKRLYEIRSAVVHFGKDAVEEADLNRFIHICRCIVIALLSREEFSGFTTMDALAEYFKHRKYSPSTDTDTHRHVKRSEHR